MIEKQVQKRTDWNVIGRLFKETSLLSECKHYCIISAWKTLKRFNNPGAISAAFSPNIVERSGNSVI